MGNLRVNKNKTFSKNFFKFLYIVKHIKALSFPVSLRIKLIILPLDLNVKRIFGRDN